MPTTAGQRKRRCAWSSPLRRFVAATSADAASRIRASSVASSTCSSSKPGAVSRTIGSAKTAISPAAAISTPSTSVKTASNVTRARSSSPSLTYAASTGIADVTTAVETSVMTMFCGP